MLTWSENSIRTTTQVSMKQCELGIGPATLAHYRLKLVDFLPPMYTYGDFLASQKPKELTSFDTIIIPFDKYVWFCMIGCISAQFLLLIKMQYLYSYVTGTRLPNDFMYEGNLITDRLFLF